MPPRWIADSSVWIDLAHGGMLDAVFRLEVSWDVPDLLLAELRRAPTAQELVDRGVQSRELAGGQIAEASALVSEDRRLSVVDVAAFLLARDLGGILLTGDARLRDRATASGVEVHGVLWLLDRLVEVGGVDLGGACGALKRLIAAGSRLPSAEVESRLRRWCR